MTIVLTSFALIGETYTCNIILTAASTQCHCIAMNSKMTNLRMGLFELGNSNSCYIILFFLSSSGLVVYANLAYTHMG